jgi:hypothetical protein
MCLNHFDILIYIKNKILKNKIIILIYFLKITYKNNYYYNFKH